MPEDKLEKANLEKVFKGIVVKRASIAEILHQIKEEIAKNPEKAKSDLEFIITILLQNNNQTNIQVNLGKKFKASP